VEIAYLYLPEHEWSVERELDATELSVTQYGKFFGPYPYARLTVVDVPDQGSGAGGMEYPTFITVGAGGQGSPTPPSNGWIDGLLITTAHEVGHQWWQSMVATNEPEEPWLDEGFADASTMLLLIENYGFDAQSLDQANSNLGYFLRRRSSFLNDPGVPMGEKAWDYSNWGVYGVAAYAKPDMALLTLGQEIDDLKQVVGDLKPAAGNQKLIAILRVYFQRYRFAHPTTQDFEKVATEVSGQDLNWFFDGLVDHSETLNYRAKSMGGGSFTVARLGQLVVPVDILVTFNDSSTQTVTWDGQGAEHTFEMSKPVRSFDIDPEHKLLIETDWYDNQLASQ
jgi:aminopeptidase N